MWKKKGCTVCMAAVLSASMMMSATVMAQEDTIAIPYDQVSAWDEIAMTKDDTVSTGVNIRATPNMDGKVIGYLYHGGAAWILNKGEEWTEIYSGGLTGFVKNEYLAFGDEVRGLAEYYGRDGVKTTWEDVKVYSQGDAAASVVKTLDYGDSLILAEDGGHWLQVQDGADRTAYVSEDDVSRALLLDTALPKDAEYAKAPVEPVSTQSPAAETYEDTEYTDSSSEGDYSDSYTDTDYSEQGSYEESYEDTYEDSYTEDSYTEEVSSSDSSSSSLPDGVGYYDEYTGTYYDYYGNPMYWDENGNLVADTGSSADSSSSSSLPDGVGYYDEYTDTYYDYYGNPMYWDENGNLVADTGSSDDSYTDSSDSSSDSGSSSSLPDGVGYYDEYTDTYYDYYGNPMYWDENGNLVADTGSSDSTDDGYDDSYDDGYDDSYEDGYEDSDDYVEDNGSSDPGYGGDDASLLAAIIYCEAGNQSYEGMVAVGAVVLNRVASSSFPNTISEVIYQSGQFTPAYSGSLSSALANGVPSACYEAAIDAMNGVNPVGNALYFNTGSGQGIKIGDHQFY